MPKEFRSLISLDEAKSIVLRHLPRIELEKVPLEKARARILAEKIISSIDVPGFDRAAMDGYAVHYEDTLVSREDRPRVLRLAGCIPMGVLAELQVGNGEAAMVSTGSMMPAGANAVVMIEYALVEADRVYIHRPVHIGENVQRASTDISFGESVLFPGIKLEAREIGVLAALGRDEVLVRRLNVGIASTGNELVPPGHFLGPGQIFDINTYTIQAAAEECGARPDVYGILPDNESEMAKTLAKMAAECDLILVSGSTSAGLGDMIFRVLDEIGITLFHGVNLKPGKPTIFGLVDEKPLLGLPGYPTSALTVFELLAAPAIRTALGTRFAGKRASGRLAWPLRTDGRQQMLAVGISRELVYPLDKGSGSITTLAGADGVIEIPGGVEYLEQGHEVQVNLFAEFEKPDLVVAGENSSIVDGLAETLGIRLRLMNMGGLRGTNYLLDGLADLACVSGDDEVPSGAMVIKSFKRELGLIYNDESALKQLEHRSIVGWQGETRMKPLLEKALRDLGMQNPGFKHFCRTHFAVAAVVASGRADLGFAEKEVARNAKLHFAFLLEDEIRFLATPKSLANPWLKHFVSVLPGA